MTVIGSEAMKSLSVDALAAPAIRFFDRGNTPKLYHDFDAYGRRRRLSPTGIARHSTGVDRTTGKRTLGVGVESRSNGTVRFEADLWKLDYNLSTSGRELLAAYWQAQNRETPARLRKKMERHFGRTHFQFDVMAEQLGDWRDFLKTVLSDASSYVGID